MITIVDCADTIRGNGQPLFLIHQIGASYETWAKKLKSEGRNPNTPWLKQHPRITKVIFLFTFYNKAHYKAGPNNSFPTLFHAFV